MSLRVLGCTGNDMCTATEQHVSFCPLKPDREVRVTLDTLDQWTEDALTQGISPATYAFSTLSAELGDHS